MGPDCGSCWPGRRSGTPWGRAPPSVKRPPRHCWRPSACPWSCTSGSGTFRLELCWRETPRRCCGRRRRRSGGRWDGPGRCVLRSENRSLEETLRSIGGFFRAYDTRFFAAEVPCDIDYQLCRPVNEELEGVLYVRAYLEQLVTENAFLRRFDPAAVRWVLTAACPGDHRELLVNLYEPVAAAALGLTLTEGDIGGLSQTPEGWACLTELLAPPGRDRRRHLLEQAGERLARRLELGLAGAACLTTFARDLVPRVEAVLDSGTGWQGIFPILG